MNAEDTQTSMVEREPVAPNVPDLLRVSPMDTSTATDVETSILDPAVQSDTFCRFVFLNKGILHSHSKIALALTPPDTSSRFYAPQVGIQQLISRCALKVGTKTLQEIDGYNFMSAYKSLFINNEHQKEREQVQSGRCVAHEFRYDDSTATTGGTANNTRSYTYGLSNGREYNSATGASFSAVTPDLKIHEWADIKNSPVFQIALSELFPMLKQTQLPLYMMSEQVSVELHFDPVNVNRCQGTQGLGSATYTIDQTQTKLIADYIYYPQDMMDAYAAANQTITMNHFDYRHSKVSVSSTTDDGQTRIRNLGGAGRIVTKVITGLQPDLVTSDLQITGKFCSISPEQKYLFGQDPAVGKQNGSLTVNLKYNDRFLYPIDVTNPARQFHNTAQAEGMVPFVTREEYAAEGTALTNDEFMGYDQNAGDDADETGILGRFNWQSYRLNRNERVNTRGIEYYYKYDGLGDGGGYTQRSWLELAKLTTLSGGYVTTNLL
tara:strand:- start:72 stop:1550 length:1479 start_codon:yes stop_codon:yes gene_type:complete